MTIGKIVSGVESVRFFCTDRTPQTLPVLFIPEKPAPGLGQLPTTETGLTKYETV